MREISVFGDPMLVVGVWGSLEGLSKVHQLATKRSMSVIHLERVNMMALVARYRRRERKNCKVKQV